MTTESTANVGMPAASNRLRTDMRALLGKEFRLAMHPTALIFLVLSSMLIIPNYPYYVVFFYTGLAVFFTCLSGRENNDVVYTMMLPVAKRDVVKARIAFAVLIEAAQLVCSVPFAILRQMMPLPGNQVGMDANIAFFGLSLVLLGIFNLVFFSLYYKNVAKIGAAFAWASAAVSVYITAAETCDHVLPFMRDRLDTPDPRFVTEKLIMLAAGVVIFCLLTAAAYVKSARSFEKLDL